MSEPMVMIALLAATPPTLVAGVSVFIGLNNIKKAEEIHILVNSNLSKVKSDLEIALDRIIKLEYLLTKKK